MESKVQAFLNSSPYTVEIKSDSSALFYHARIHKQIPREWAAIVGDTVHNLRAALDFVARGLVLANGGLPTRDTCFPIGNSASQSNRRLKEALKGASKKSIRFVNLLRPFEGGNTKLTQLHALDVTDKHKTALIVGATNACINLGTKITLEDGTEDHSLSLSIPVEKPKFPLMDGDVVLRVPQRSGESISPDSESPAVLAYYQDIFPAPENTQTQSDEIDEVARIVPPISMATPQYRVTFQLVFGDIDTVRGLPLIDSLIDMHQHVKKIVDISRRIQ